MTYYVTRLKEQIFELKETLHMISDAVLDQRDGLEKLTRESRISLESSAKEYNTQLHQLPSLFKTLLDDQTVGAFLIGHDGRYLLSNAVAESIFGSAWIRNLDQLSGSDCGIFLSDMRTQCTSDSLPWQQCARGAATKEALLYLRRKEVRNGLWIRTVSMPLLDDKNASNGAVAFFLDVTEQIQIEEQMKQLLHTLEQQLSSIEIAHALLSQLATKLSLSNAAESMTRQGSAATKPKAIEKLVEQEKKIQVTTGEFEAAAIGATLERTEKVWSTHGTAPSTAESLTVASVPAINEAPTEPKKSIGAFVGEANRRNASLALGAQANVKTDNSPPASKETSKDSSNGNSSSARSNNGQAVHAPGNAASPSSSVPPSNLSPSIAPIGNGNRPSLPPVVPLDKNEPSSLVKKNVLGKRLPTNNVLIVDDIPVNQKLLRMQLKRLGFKIDTAANGKEAIEAVLKVDYDFVFMDLDMPVMDGPTAAAAIRKLEANTDKHVPIIAMTSYDRDVDRQVCINSGMDDYLVKGATQKQLADVVVKFSPRMAAIGEQVSEKGFKVEDVILSADLNELQKNMGKEELEEVSRLFGSSLSTFVECMRLAIDERNTDAFGHFAHCIKGPAAAMGLTGITSIIGDMMSSSEAEDWLHVGYLYLNLRTNFSHVLNKLKTLCDSQQAS